jgi:hypothetical protein
MLEIKKREKELDGLANEIATLKLKKQTSSLGDQLEAEPVIQKELAEVRMRAQQEIKASKESEIRRFELWKKESVQDIEYLVFGLL